MRRVTIISVAGRRRPRPDIDVDAGESAPRFSWGWAAAALDLAVASTLIQLTINWAQGFVSATRATVIYASEPVWGGLLGDCTVIVSPHLLG